MQWSVSYKHTVITAQLIAWLYVMTVISYNGNIEMGSDCTRVLTGADSCARSKHMVVYLSLGERLGCTEA